MMSAAIATSAGPRRGSPRLRLSSLGERESGTAQLEEAAAYREASKEYTPRAA